MQDKFADHCHNYACVRHNAIRLVKLANIFEAPIIATHQVKFGAIDAEVAKHHPEGIPTFEKSKFSMINSAVAEVLEGLKQNIAILFGNDAHVCVKQTALDLIKMGYHVHLVVDACSAMGATERAVGIQSMRDQGVQITTFESLAFEMLGDSEHPKFKQVLSLLKDRFAGEQLGL